MRRDPLASPRPLIEAVYRYVAYRLGDGPEAEDVTSAVFERALRYRESYDASKGSPIAWLVGIARRELQNAPVQHGVLPDDLAEAGGDPASAVVERLALADAVETLSPAEQELLALRYGADLSARQTAEVLGMRTNTVEVAVHRALAKLRESMTETPPGPGSTASALRADPGKTRRVRKPASSR